ncbi:MAG: nicotinate phosphoribosyltransferase [Prevotellaceae bacterium]|jgi:nicotinate phosphoribosyltransferase|nr:nicotinate phosphoribosyltransferase [Prevotellaceae bacterium]
MIIKYFTDNDLYKFSVMLAIQKLYPNAMVRYRFFNRGETDFPEGFAEALKAEVKNMSQLKLSKQEKQFIEKRCYFFDPVFIDFLDGYTYNPDEVTISQTGGKLDILIEGYWYRTVLWEVPLMAMISELYFRMRGISPDGNYISKTVDKAVNLKRLNADYSDFGTRRRFSFDVHDMAVKTLKENSGNNFKGTSNVYLAMKHNTIPIGTMPHEWFMYHGAIYGYRGATSKALEAWVDVFQGSLGITLTDTYTSDMFFNSFGLKHAKLFDGVRCDSGNPIEFADRVVEFYRKNRIDPTSKTIVYSDSLNVEEVERIKKHVANRIHDTYGIGTFFSNDVGATPLNMVIKLTQVKINPERKDYFDAIKLSDVRGKNTGDSNEIKIAKLTLNID